MSGTAQSSGLLTAAATTLVTGKSVVSGLAVITDGTNTATVTVYDNTAASGTVIAKMLVPGTVGGREYTIDAAVRADRGVHVTIAGTGAAAIVYFGAT